MSQGVQDWKLPVLSHGWPLLVYCQTTSMLPLGVTATRGDTAFLVGSEIGGLAVKVFPPAVERLTKTSPGQAPALNKVAPETNMLAARSSGTSGNAPKGKPGPR